MKLSGRNAKCEIGGVGWFQTFNYVPPYLLWAYIGTTLLSLVGLPHSACYSQRQASSTRYFYAMSDEGLREHCVEVQMDPMGALGVLAAAAASSAVEVTNEPSPHALDRLAEVAAADTASSLGVAENDNLIMLNNSSTSESSEAIPIREKRVSTQMSGKASFSSCICALSYSYVAVSADPQNNHRPQIDDDRVLSAPNASVDITHQGMGTQSDSGSFANKNAPLRDVTDEIGE